MQFKFDLSGQNSSLDDCQRINNHNCRQHLNQLNQLGFIEKAADSRGAEKKYPVEQNAHDQIEIKHSGIIDLRTFFFFESEQR